MVKEEAPSASSARRDRERSAESGSEHPRSGAREASRGSRVAMVNEEASAPSNARRDREYAQLPE
jgi:hypothetical protein